MPNFGQVKRFLQNLCDSVSALDLLYPSMYHTVRDWQRNLSWVRPAEELNQNEFICKASSMSVTFPIKLIVLNVSAFLFCDSKCCLFILTCCCVSSFNHFWRFYLPSFKNICSLLQICCGKVVFQLLLSKQQDILAGITALDIWLLPIIIN